jgi:hypothetical protein
VSFLVAIENRQIPEFLWKGRHGNRVINRWRDNYGPWRWKQMTLLVIGIGIEGQMSKQLYRVTGTLFFQKSIELVLAPSQWKIAYHPAEL